jgi:cholesterol oxidase
MAEEIYDYIVIGSGFGGSVSAMRLSEKGYSVLVIEKGKWWKAEDFPKSNWNLKKFLWVPALRWFGIMKLDFFKEVLVLSGAGVGGGSLVYANTHMVPKESFWTNPIWSNIKDWKTELAPFYEKAKFMLGSSKYLREFPEDKYLKQVADEMGRGDTYKAVDYVGVYFGDTQKEKDPYFNGLGPMRKGCTECAGCMVGCRENAKNTLDKNYLWFAQKFGTKIIAETLVTKIENQNGEYQIHTESQTNSVNKNKQVFRSKGLVVSGGVLGTLKLLFEQKFIHKTLAEFIG